MTPTIHDSPTITNERTATDKIIEPQQQTTVKEEPYIKPDTAQRTINPIRTVNRLNQTTYTYRTERTISDRQRELASRSNIVKKIVWGPILWKLFHTLGFYFKNVENDSYRREIGGHVWGMIGKLIDTIPCPSCKHHASYEFKRTTVPDLSNKINSNFIEMWAFNFHNNVNRRIRRFNYSYTTLTNTTYDGDLYQLVDEYYESIKSGKTRLEKSIITSYIDNIYKLTNTVVSQEIIDKETQTSPTLVKNDVITESSFI